MLCLLFLVGPPLQMENPGAPVARDSPGTFAFGRVSSNKDRVRSGSAADEIENSWRKSWMKNI